MIESFDVAIVGGGQAGLAMSYHLAESGVSHVVLEAGRVGEAWRSERWDSFHLVTPNFTLALPGMPYDGDDPEGFTPCAGVIAYLERYRERFRLPVRTGVRVESVERAGDGYRLATRAGALLARDVVVAAGAFPKPNVPPASAGLGAGVRQLHAVEYRNPDALPPGAVLVVGSGQSGAQIAEELHRAGRRVFLSLGSCGRLPRRYRGHDVVWWMLRLGLTEKRVGDLPKGARFACKPILTGREGGREIDLRALAREGLVPLGRLLDARDGEVAFAQTANESLDKADEFAIKTMDEIDAFAAARGLDLPADGETRGRFARKGPRVPERARLDLAAENVTSTVWATGYRPSFPWVRVPVFDENGFPRHVRGVTDSPGLYFLGLAYLHRGRSDTLFGVGEDALYLAGHVAARRAERVAVPTRAAP